MKKNTTQKYWDFRIEEEDNVLDVRVEALPEENARRSHNEVNPILVTLYINEESTKELCIELLKQFNTLPAIKIASKLDDTIGEILGNLKRAKETLWYVYKGLGITLRKQPAGLFLTQKINRVSGIIDKLTNIRDFVSEADMNGCLDKVFLADRILEVLDIVTW